ncbi:hypothetical protein LTR97_004146 [Elasticomyces elasticus]|uniref:Uncharacterized protein n=1 Tax=Elasticomyces elasticus TaxID=574655 RepID=A0AAN7W8M6_9PEZI|nr:hypothetical protein LTR97_004146 [Elasticomyces elasticus]
MPLVTDPRVVEHRDRFTNLVAHSSPLLIVLEGLGEDVSGYHARFEQHGAHEDFDLRDQKIYTDKTLIDRVYNAWRASFFPQAAMADANVFYIHAMLAVRMITHELAHVLTTYLFQGRQNTPPHVRGAAPRQPIVDIGESGEFMERGIYGGTIDAVFDQQDEYGALGYLWLVVQDIAYRIDLLSMANFWLVGPPADNSFMVRYAKYPQRHIERFVTRRRGPAGANDVRLRDRCISCRASSTAYNALPPRQPGVERTLQSLLRAIPVRSRTSAERIRRNGHKAQML